MKEIDLSAPVSSSPRPLGRQSSRSPSGGGNSKSPSQRRTTLCRYSRKSNTLITECSRNQAVEIIISLLELIIMKGLPFSIFAKVNRLPGPFDNFARLCRPGFVDECKHSATESGGNSRYQLFNRIYENTTKMIKTILGSGYGKTVFDGWVDQTGSLVVNVLLHVKEKINTGISVFFWNLSLLVLRK